MISHHFSKIFHENIAQKKIFLRARLLLRDSEGFLLLTSYFAELQRRTEDQVARWTFLYIGSVVKVQGCVLSPVGLGMSGRNFSFHLDYRAQS